MYKQLKGVIEVLPGYSGGDTENPTYEEVCTGTTGHAEVVHISYDQELIDFTKLLEIFFKTHDPTSLNRQGEDVGTQYRSIIFWHSESQREEAVKTIERLNATQVYEKSIITKVEQFNEFYEAEEYHKNYFSLNPEKAYCNAVVRPKMEKFEKIFKNSLK
ncbi:MAG: peptide-methionine (S)-S-oxide reductase [Vicingaceae bacterium]|jgi:peptide-methionine (S)-S-oxide reductase